MKGIINRIISEKAFGFIRTASREDYFFHRADFNGHFNDLVIDYDSGKSIEVQFIAEKTSKGLRAREVSRTDYPNSVDGYGDGL